VIAERDGFFGDYSQAPKDEQPQTRIPELPPVLVKILSEKNYGDGSE
jgi:hypothetical protein